MKQKGAYPLAPPLFLTLALALTVTSDNQHMHDLKRS